VKKQAVAPNWVLLFHTQRGGSIQWLFWWSLFKNRVPVSPIIDRLRHLAIFWTTAVRRCGSWGFLSAVQSNGWKFM